MIKKVTPEKTFAPVAPKSGIQGEALPDAGSREAPVDRRRQKKEEDAPGVKVRLSRKHRQDEDTRKDDGAGSDAERKGRKKIDVMA
jgi:hypothetical protein